MFFISYAKPRRAEPKGVLTNEKCGRIFRIRGFAEQRANALQRIYNNQGKGKKLVDNIKRTAKKAKTLLANRPNPRNETFERKLRLAVLENTTSYLSYLQGLLEFAVNHAANHRFIAHLQEQIELAKKNVADTKGGNI